MIKITTIYIDGTAVSSVPLLWIMGLHKSDKNYKKHSDFA
jgi:hypothetical protein